MGACSVMEMHCMMDAGTVVNPDRVHAQMEGAMIFGLSLALMGEIEFKEGAASAVKFSRLPGSSAQPGSPYGKNPYCGQ